jgi:hypothetical protein
MVGAVVEHHLLRAAARGAGDHHALGHVQHHLFQGVDSTAHGNVSSLGSCSGCLVQGQGRCCEAFRTAQRATATTNTHLGHDVRAGQQLHHVAVCCCLQRILQAAELLLH